MNRTRQSYVRVFASVLALLVTACAQHTHSTVDQAADFAGLTTYAWLDDGGNQSSKDSDIAAMARQFRAAVDQELLGKGMQPVAFREADLIVSQTLAIERHNVSNDPFHLRPLIEQYEEAVLTIEVVAMGKDSSVWRSVGRSRLRLAAVSVGLHAPKMVDTGEPREWKVNELAAAALKDFPEP